MDNLGPKNGGEWNHKGALLVAQEDAVVQDGEDQLGGTGKLNNVKL